MTKPTKPKPAAKPAATPPAVPAKPAGRGRARVAPEPLVLTEKLFVRARPERVYHAAINPTTRAGWDRSLAQLRFSRPKKGETAVTKPVQGALVDAFFPMRLGGLFQLRYSLVRQPQGFALEAVRGSFGVLAGLAESWSFQPFKGGTEVTLTRSLAPRLRPLTNWVQTNQRAAMRRSLEGLKGYAEANPK